MQRLILALNQLLLVSESGCGVVKQVQIIFVSHSRDAVGGVSAMDHKLIAYLFRFIYFFSFNFLL